MFDFAAPRPRRRASLTPMIDVVFLLLIFFMLAAQFTRDTVLPLATGTAGGDWHGPPRLVRVGADRLWLNGRETTLDGLPEALAPLMTAPGVVVVVQAAGDADLQRLVGVMQALRAAGIANLALVE